MKQHLPAWSILLLLACVCSSQVYAQDSEVAAIRALQTQQSDAWNRHDAAAYSNLFTADGDVVNVLGWWWRGKDEIRRKLTGAFAVVFRDSRLTITDVNVRLLDEHCAIVHVRWTMEGGKAPPGAAQPPRQGIQLQVLRKDHGQWLIASFQNTNSVPETEFPHAPS